MLIIKRAISFLIDSLILVSTFIVGQHIISVYILLYAKNKFISFDYIFISMIMAYYIIPYFYDKSIQTIGQKLVKIKLIENGSDTVSIIKILINKILFFAAPYTLFVIITSFFGLYQINYTQYLNIYPYTVSFLFFLTILAPVSILFSSGRVGIYDIICNIIYVNTKTDTNHFNLNLKKFLINSFFCSTSISISLFILLNIIYAPLFDAQTINEIKNKTSKLGLSIDNNIFSDIFPEIPKSNSIFFIEDGMYFMSSFHNSYSEKIFMGNIFGLPKFTNSSVIGFSFKLSSLNRNIEVCDSNNCSFLKKGNSILYSVIYLDSLGFQNHETKGKIIDETLNRITNNRLIMNNADYICVILCNKTIFLNTHLRLYDKYYFDKIDFVLKKDINDYNSNNITTYFVENAFTKDFITKYDFQ